MSDLAFLDEIVLLERGQAAILFPVLKSVRKGLLHRDQQAGHRWTTTESLALKPLASLLKRIEALEARDRRPLPVPVHKPGRGRRPPKRKPPKPHRLRVPYDQMATVRFFYARMLASVVHDSDEQLLLAGVLGRFHQPSLSLESHIRLAPPSGPGSQTSLL